MAGRLLPGLRWTLRRLADRATEAAQRRGVKLPGLESGGRRETVRRLLRDPVVIAAAEVHARDNGLSQVRVMGQVERYAREIVPAFNAFLYFRVGIPVAGRVARGLYRIRLTSEEGLAALAEHPGERVGVVFVMNHRSNLDYVILAHLTADRTSLTFAAGEWARVPPIGPLARAMGAFFVRRRSGNELYRRVLEGFARLAVELGLTQIIFPEGGLSRDGTIREPKIGLFDYMLRRFDPDRADILFVPVAVNYDWVLEDHALLQPGGPEAGLWGWGGLLTSTIASFARNLLQARRSGGYRLGEAVVAFGTPVSAREYEVAHGVSFRRMEREPRGQEVKALAASLMTLVREAVADAAVPLVARALLEAGGSPVSGEDLVARAQSLARGDGPLDFEAALRTLTMRGLVRAECGGYRPVTGGVKVLEYYASSVFR